MKSWETERTLENGDFFFLIFFWWVWILNSRRKEGESKCREKDPHPVSYHRVAMFSAIAETPGEEGEKGRRTQKKGKKKRRMEFGNGEGGVLWVVETRREI